MTQQELADAVGTSLKSVNNWENDRTSPRGAMTRLREVLGAHLSGSPRDRLKIAETHIASVSSVVDADGDVKVTAFVAGGKWGGRLEVHYWPGENARIDPSDLLAIATETHARALARTTDLDEGGEGHAGGPAPTQPPAPGPGNQPGVTPFPGRKGESKLSSIDDPYGVTDEAADDPDGEGGGRSNEGDH